MASFVGDHVGTGEDLIFRDAHHVGLAAEVRHRKHITTEPRQMDTLPNRVDPATDFVAHSHWQR